VNHALKIKGLFSQRKPEKEAIEMPRFEGASLLRVLREHERRELAKKLKKRQRGDDSWWDENPEENEEDSM